MRTLTVALYALALACGSTSRPVGCVLGVATPTPDGGQICCIAAGLMAVVSDAGWECGLPPVVTQDAGPPSCAAQGMASCGPMCIPVGDDCCALDGLHCPAGQTCFNLGGSSDDDSAWSCVQNGSSFCGGTQKVACGTQCEPAGGGCCDFGNPYYCQAGLVCVLSGGGWSCSGP
jgi:hypothetical protein